MKWGKKKSLKYKAKKYIKKNQKTRGEQKSEKETLGTYGFHNGYMVSSAPKLRVSKVC